MVGDVPHGRYGYRQAGGPSPILSLHFVLCGGVRHRGQNLVAIVERLVQVFQNLGLGREGAWAALLAALRRRLVLNFVEEGKIAAGHMHYLLRKSPHSSESGSG